MARQPDDQNPSEIKPTDAVQNPSQATGVPLQASQEAAPPVVPPPGEYPLGYETIHDKPRKLWTVGTLVYTSAGLMVLFFWLLFGDFAISMRDRSVGPVVQLMLRGFGTNNLVMSILLSMIPIAISMVLGPIVSYKSDRLRSRWGRRIPFLLIPTPIAALAMIGLAFCPHIATYVQHISGDVISRKTALLTVFGFFWTCYEFAAIIAGSVMGGLINDVVPRPVLGRFFGLFRAVSLIDGMIFNWYIMGHAEEHFTAIFIWIAAVFGIGFTLMCFMVKEGDYPAPDLQSTDHRAGGFLAASRIYFRECFRLPHYRWIFAAFTMAALSSVPINSWTVMYAKHVDLGLDKWAVNGAGFGAWRFGYGGIMTVTYVCSLTLAYGIGSLVDRLGALRMAIIAMAIYATSCFVGTFMIHDAASFGWALLAHGVLSGTYFTAAASLGQVLLPRAKFAQFASAGSLVTQSVSFAVAPLLGQALDLTNSDYRITFLLSGVFSAAAVLLLGIVYHRYQRMGGREGYVAPVPEPLTNESRGFEVQAKG